MSRQPLSRDSFVLSIVLPVFNEETTVEEILARVRATPYRKEIVVVDDASSDGTPKKLEELKERGWIDRLVVHEKNQGKGAALRTAFGEVTGDITLIQDADLEYDPSDYPKLLAPFFDGKADVVYGSRFLTGESHRVLLFWHSVANRALTILSNMITNLNLTDMETCYKAFRTEIVKELDVREKRFGVEPEMTAKIARLGCRIYEVGISYDGRSYQEGKKIGWRDAVSAFLCVMRYGLFYRPQRKVEDILAAAAARRQSEEGGEDDEERQPAARQEVAQEKAPERELEVDHA